MTDKILKMCSSLLWLPPVLLALLLAACAGGPAPKSEARLGQQQDYTAADIDTDIQENFQRAVAFLKEEKYDRAIEILSAVVEKEQRFAAPFVNLGMAYVKQGDNKQAEENLRKALDIDLGHPVANNELGLLYRKEGRFEDARKAYENALVVHPDYLPARKNLGILCEIYLRDLNCALEHFEQYQKYVPDDKAVNIWVVDLQRRLGQ